MRFAQQMDQSRRHKSRRRAEIIGLWGEKVETHVSERIRSFCLGLERDTIENGGGARRGWRVSTPTVAYAYTLRGHVHQGGCAVSIKLPFFLDEWRKEARLKREIAPGRLQGRLQAI